MSDETEPVKSAKPAKPTPQATPATPAASAASGAPIAPAAAPAAAAPAVEGSPTMPLAAEPTAKRTWRERVSGTGERLHTTRGLLAATLAAVIVGGLGGAAIHAAFDGPDGPDRGRFERGSFGPGGAGPGGAGPGGFERGGPVGESGRDFQGERPVPPGSGGVPGVVPTPVPPTTTPKDEESPSS